MSELTKGGPTAAKLMAIVAVIVVLVFGLFWSGVRRENEFADAANARASDYSSLLAAEVRRACEPLAAPQRQVCIYEKAAGAELRKRDNQREEAELVAQRKSALWTGIMGLAALIGMGLSTIGVWLVWTTFRETKRAADEAKRSVDSFMASERARLTVIRPFQAAIDLIEDVAAVGISVSNFGRSPCRVEKVEWFESESLPATWPETMPQLQRVGGTVQAGASEQVLTHLRPTLKSNFICGHVSYDTQFSRDCRSHFIWELGMPTADDYNDPTLEVHAVDGLSPPAAT